MNNNDEKKQETFSIRVASSDARVERVNQLIRKQFLWRGYAITELELNKSPNHITLELEHDAKTVGAITLVIDIPLDLEAAETFKVEIDSLRSNGRKLAELTNFALQGRPNNKRYIAALVHVAFIYAYRIHMCSDFVIEVHRHSLFYEKMLGFKHCGTAKTRPWANAPAVLLCLDMKYLDEKIQRFGGMAQSAIGEKSLYPYFFSKPDEDGIAQRLARM